MKASWLVKSCMGWLLWGVGVVLEVIANAGRGGGGLGVGRDGDASLPARIGRGADGGLIGERLVLRPLRQKPWLSLTKSGLTKPEDCHGMKFITIEHAQCETVVIVLFILS